MSQAHVLADPLDRAPAVGDAEKDVADMRRAIDLGRESARTEPLLDDETVFAMARTNKTRR